jgi:hypothetical protein
LFAAEACLTEAQAQLAAAEDHLRFLQTDPAYAHELVAKHLRGEHLALRFVERMWKYIAADLIIYATRDVTNVSILLSEASHVAESFRYVSGSIAPGMSLPIAFERAMCTLELLAINLYNYE